MNEARWLELRTRRAAGGELTAEEDRELADHLQADEAALARWLDDDALEQDLRTLGRTTRDADQFVAGVMARLPVDEPAPPPRATRFADVEEPLAPPLPVAAPPAVSRSAPRVDSNRSPRSTPPRGAAFFGIPRPVLVTTAAGLLLLAGFVLGRWSREERTPVARDSGDSSRGVRPGEVSRPGPRTAPIPAADFVEAVWRHGGPRGDVLPVGSHELTRGAARFALGDGLEAELLGPASLELRPDREVALRSGKLRLIGELRDDGVRVATPDARLRELTGDAELNVVRDVATDVQVRRGSLALIDRAETDDHAEPLRLSHGQFEHARIFAPVAATEMAPRAAELSGPDARFLGRISFDGASLDFRSPSVFAQTRSHVERRFSQAPDELHALWGRLAASLGTGDSPATIQINGRSFSPLSADEMIQSLQESTSRVIVDWNHDGSKAPPPGGGATNQGGTKKKDAAAASEASASESGGSFHAVLVINGETRTFRSRAEFEAARRELLAPWRQLIESP